MEARLTSAVPAVMSTMTTSLPFSIGCNSPGPVSKGRASNSTRWPPKVSSTFPIPPGPTGRVTRASWPTRARSEATSELSVLRDERDVIRTRVAEQPRRERRRTDAGDTRLDAA